MRVRNNKTEYKERICPSADAVPSGEFANPGWPTLWLLLHRTEQRLWTIQGGIWELRHPHKAEAIHVSSPLVSELGKQNKAQRVRI